MEFLIAVGWSQLYSDVFPITASNYKVQYHGFCRTLSLCRYGRNAILRNCYSFLIGIDVSLCSDTVELYRLRIIDLFNGLSSIFANIHCLWEYTVEVKCVVNILKNWETFQSGEISNIRFRQIYEIQNSTSIFSWMIFCFRSRR